jgi:hypothetical protein
VPKRDEGSDPTPGFEEARQRVLERRAAHIVRWLPSGQLGELYYPYWDWDEPPFFKCFLRVDATGDEIRIRCFARPAAPSTRPIRRSRTRSSGRRRRGGAPAADRVMP